ncbi:MAG: DegT/DnrJ/EryC1/StrS family aminotransferase [Gammaproteobacteria bacterium]|nr:DegT/DnrJ/EryC1/StrS family aminotransferase [Gammaproteobacteria bacterium]
MQFINLARQYAQYKNQIDKNIQAVLDHGQYILGPEVYTLEEKLAEYVGVKHCITVANGTDALMIAMMALDIHPGDEVITTPFTFIATGEMIALIGAKPIFVDIDPNTYQIDASKIAAAITNKTKCIMPVSLYGQCADMDAINKIAKQNKIPVIEDGAQSFGATYQNKKSCALSTIGCTSFFPSKPLGCYGDGGACFTNDDELAIIMRQIRTHGQEKRYHHVRLGMNSRLDTLQAAILLAKFPHFENEVNARIKIGKRYDQLLGSDIKKMTIMPGNTCVYAQYTIEVSERPLVQQYLKEMHIPTAVHYPIPLHKQPIFAEAYQYAKHLVTSEHASQHVISLPMDPYLSDDEQQFICNHVIAALKDLKLSETA